MLVARRRLRLSINHVEQPLQKRGRKRKPIEKCRFQWRQKLKEIEVLVVHKKREKKVKP